MSWSSGSVEGEWVYGNQRLLTYFKDFVDKIHLENTKTLNSTFAWENYASNLLK